MDQVTLVDGTVVDLAEWPILAGSADYSHLETREAGSGYWSYRLYVRRHPDGRALVYASEQFNKGPESQTPAERGAVLVLIPDVEQIEEALDFVIRDVPGGEYLVDSCMRTIRRSIGQ